MTSRAERPPSPFDGTGKKRAPQRCGARQWSRTAASEYESFIEGRLGKFKEESPESPLRRFRCLPAIDQGNRCRLLRRRFCHRVHRSGPPSLFGQEQHSAGGTYQVRDNAGPIEPYASPGMSARASPVGSTQEPVSGIGFHAARTGDSGYFMHVRDAGTCEPLGGRFDSPSSDASGPISGSDSPQPTRVSSLAGALRLRQSARKAQQVSPRR